MREFLNYSLRGQEGLRSYIKYLAVGLAALFIVNVQFIIIGKFDTTLDRVYINLYETVGVFFAAAIFGFIINRLMHISVNGGTSRMSILLGTGVLSLVFSAVTSVMIEAAYFITDGIYTIFGMKLDCMGMSNLSPTYVNNEILLANTIKNKLEYDPRFIFFNMCVVSMVIMLAYAGAILFVAVKQRINKYAAVISTGILAIIYWAVFTDQHPGSFFGEMVSSMDNCLFNIAEILYPNPIEPYGCGTYPGAVIQFLSIGLGAFVAGYLIYVLLIIRAPVSGDKKGE